YENVVDASIWTFVTANSEYHMRSGVCVAVRDLRHGELTREHPAVGSKMLGGIGYREELGYSAHYGTPSEGEKICFSNDVLTSPVSSVRRPPLEIVALYDENAA
ncbi:MAG: hypothetical protein AAFQ82_22495, partial [Myxococcota bacterium]